MSEDVHRKVKGDRGNGLRMFKRRLDTLSWQYQVWFNVARAVEQTQKHDRVVLVPIDHNVLEAGVDGTIARQGRARLEGDRTWERP
jgi:hypothetical protein